MQALAITVPTIGEATLAQRQAHTDEQLLGLWLHGRSEHTQRAYARDAARFRDFVAVPLALVTLGHLQDFDASLSTLAPATKARTLSAVKSLLGFAHRLGYVTYDVGRALRLPPQKATLAERIMSEADVHRLLALETNPRNRVLLRLLYASGLRVSEVVGLRWCDLQERSTGGQVTVLGKGAKTRAVLLPLSVWGDLLQLRGDGGRDAPVFVSRKGGALDTSMVWRIVRAAARRAGIDAAVSPHWLRHAHASHALDRGAPVHLVSATLGHSNLATTGRYTHARPSESSSSYLAV